MNTNSNNSKSCIRSCMRRTTESSSTTSKRVEWKGKCRVRRIDTLNKEERFNAWYQPDDYHSFKEENRQIVLRLASTTAIGRESEKNDYVSCRGIRGLEDLLNVLDEQETSNPKTKNEKARRNNRTPYTWLWAFGRSGRKLKVVVTTDKTAG
jgi:hypothetical protein